MNCICIQLFLILNNTQSTKANVLLLFRVCIIRVFLTQLNFFESTPFLNFFVLPNKDCWSIKKSFLLGLKSFTDAWYSLANVLMAGLRKGQPVSLSLSLSLLLSLLLSFSRLTHKNTCRHYRIHINVDRIHIFEREKERDRARERDRETERETERERDRETERETERETDIEK